MRRCSPNPPFIRGFPPFVALHAALAGYTIHFRGSATTPTPVPRPLALLAALLVLAQACTPRATTALTYDTDGPAEDYPFAYADTAGNAYLRKLRQSYALDAVTASAKTDLERVLAVLHWTHGQWSHNGSNVPSAPDALTILAEVADGGKYRCVEYGIVSSEALQAIGIPARVIGLKTADVATRKWGAGHVAAEAYLGDAGKWVFLDGQFDIVATLDGVPLNAFEFGEALRARPGDIVLVDADGPVSPKRRRNYLRFVGEYLHHLDVRFDNRVGVPREERRLVDGKSSLMLVPRGAQPPAVFQRDSPMDYLAYTSAPAALYAAPE